MATAMADALAAADPANAETFRANAAALNARLRDLDTEIAARLRGARGGRFIVFHDAYRYFEDAYGVPAAGAISLSDASSPGPARVEAVRGLIRSADIACVFIEPQFNARLAERLIEGTSAKIATLDPQGADAPLGAGFYPALLSNLAAGVADCLSPSG